VRETGFPPPRCSEPYLHERSSSESEQPSRQLLPSSATSRRPGSSDIDLLHRYHRLKGAFLPLHHPVFAPTACAFLATIADDRIPLTVCLCLVICCDLEGERLAVPERRAAVETSLLPNGRSPPGKVISPRRHPFPSEFRSRPDRAAHPFTA
jgi:hypothetical protein